MKNDTYEVTVYPDCTGTYMDMVLWCKGNTDEYDTSISEDETEDAFFLLDAIKEGRAKVFHPHKAVQPVMFYLFNATDALHFKLRWANYL
ncbi:hypothetical protein [Paraburkholderia sp. BR10882]|uniref:hypothetical protein n=1 Tax=unclassified Paraburkholderia TaxID=2615204 RepID=UPI0034CD5E92